MALLEGITRSGGRTGRPPTGTPPCSAPA